jgi:hypothetical protein
LDAVRDEADFAAVREPLFAAGFAAALPVFLAAVRPDAARLVDFDADFAADFVADFAVERAAGFAADFAAVRPFAVVAFFAVERDVADFAALREGAFFAVDDFAADDFALDVFALAAVPRADDERALVLFDALLFDVLLFEAVLRDAGFFAPAADELRELDDREDERVAAAIVRVTSARPWVTSPIVASPHVASAISPPWVINDPPESICANGTPPAWFSTACTGRLCVRRPRGQHGQLLLVRDEFFAAMTLAPFGCVVCSAFMVAAASARSFPGRQSVRIPLPDIAPRHACAARAIRPRPVCRGRTSACSSSRSSARGPAARPSAAQSIGWF